jgi:Spy/CpxP family protein refolding chaperone
MFGFLIGSLSLFGLIKAWRWGRRGRHGHRRWMLRRLFHHLDTTPGQERVILQAVDATERSMWAARQELWRSRGSFAKAMRGEHFDGAAVTSSFDAQQAAVDELKKSVREGMASLHEALSPEQRARLGDLIEFGPGRGPGRWGSARRHHRSDHPSSGPTPSVTL